MELRQELETMILTQSLSAEDRVCARNILLLLPDEYLEVIMLLIQSPNFGWHYLVQNVRTKQELMKTNADEKAWGTVFADEVQHLRVTA